MIVSQCSFEYYKFEFYESRGKQSRNHVNEEKRLGTSNTIQSDNSLECIMSFDAEHRHCKEK